MELTAVEHEMFMLLTTSEPKRCAYLGEQLWHFGRGLRAKGTSTCPWARPAGKVLHRLKDKGLARRVRNGEWVRA